MVQRDDAVIHLGSDHADRHKGKVQFIDFWATWCGGCRRTIKEYEPIKKELGENLSLIHI